MATKRIREVIPDCPECGDPMRLRANRETGESFWGCSDFPNCRGTRPADSPDTADDGDADLPSERFARRDRNRFRE